MIGSMSTRNVLITISLAGAAVVLAMAAPQPVSKAALGSKWQCSKTAFVLTTCRQASNDDLTRQIWHTKNPPA
jgi:hypothetical protein